MSEPEYNDDRHGMMRVHIADQRGHVACSRFTRNTLRAHAKAHRSPVGSLTKREIAWYMAQNGLIDAAGNLRDGFPS